MGEAISKESKEAATKLNGYIDERQASQVIARTWRKLQRTRAAIKIIQPIAHFDDNVAKLICRYVMRNGKEFPSDTMVWVKQKHITPLFLHIMGNGNYRYSN